MEEQIETQMRTIVRKLKTLNGENLAEEEDEGFKFYKTLKDAFNGFDKDGNAELQYQPGSSSRYKAENLTSRMPSIPWMLTSLTSLNGANLSSPS